MRSFCLMVCLREDTAEVPRKPGFKQCLERIIGLFKPQDTESWLINLKIYEDMEAFIISLPYTLEELKSMSEAKAVRIVDFVEKTCKLNRIENVIIPKCFDAVRWMSIYPENKYDGRKLYKSLAGNILYEICGRSRESLGALGITVIHAEEDEVLAQIIPMLSKQVKYLTIISDNKNRIEEVLNETYSETGLSISVTSDYKTAMKSADLIINLGNSSSNILKAKCSEEALILNLGAANTEKFYGDNAIINGIEVKLPESIADILPESVRHYFSDIELAEIILSHRYVDVQEAEKLKKLAQGFKRDGYLIDGFKGRHNILSLEDIKINL